MFGSLGGAELLLILVLALLLFGPRKLPEIGRTIGKGMSEFRKATSEFKSSLEREVDLSDVKQARDDLRGARQEMRETISAARDLAVPREKPAPAITSPTESDPAEPAPSDPPPMTRPPGEATAPGRGPAAAPDEPDDDDRRT